MKNKEFLIWLDGYFSFTEEPELSPRQWQIIQNHINLTKEVEGLVLKEVKDIDLLLSASEKNRNGAALRTILYSQPS